MDCDEGVLPAIAGPVQCSEAVDGHSTILSDADHPGDNPVRRNIPKVGGSISEPVRHSDETAIRHKKPVAASPDLVQRCSPVDIREAPLSDPPG